MFEDENEYLEIDATWVESEGDSDGDSPTKQSNKNKKNNKRLTRKFSKYERTLSSDDEHFDADIKYVRPNSSPETPLAKAVSSKYFILIRVVLTVFALGISCAFSFTAPGWSWYNIVLVASYVVFSLAMLAEILVRMLTQGTKFFTRYEEGRRYYNWLNCSDALIVLADILLDISLVIYRTFLNRKVHFLGTVIAMRVGIFVMYHKKLYNMFKGMYKSIVTFIFVFLFLFSVLMIFALISHLLYHPDNYKDCGSFCMNFSSMYQSFFSMFYVMTGDEWSKAALSAEKLIPGSQLFFILFIVIAGYTMLNVVTGIIVDSIIQKDNRPEKLFKELQVKMERLENHLDRVFKIQKKIAKKLEVEI